MPAMYLPILSSLRTRLLALVLAAMLPLVWVIVQTGADQRAAVTASAERRAMAIARDLAGEQTQAVREGQRMLVLLGQVPAVYAADPKTCPTVLSGLVAGDPRFANIGVIALDGWVSCSGVAMDKPVYLGDRPYFRRVLETHKLAVADYHVGRIVQRPALIMAHPVLDAHGAVRSVIYASLSLDWVASEFQRVGLPKGSSLTVLDRNFSVVTRVPDPQRWFGKVVSDLPLIHGLHGGKVEGVVEGPGLDGEVRLFAYSRLADLPGDNDLYVAVGIPAKAAYAEANAILRRNLLLWTGLLVLVMALAWGLGSGLVLRRLRAVMAAAARLRAGDLSARSGLNGSDEIAALGATFDGMAIAVEQRTREAEDNLKRAGRLSRIYQVLSGINQAILRIRDPDDLLREAVRIAHERGRFHVAWAAVLDPAAGVLRPSTHAGQAGEGIRQLAIPVQPEEGDPYRPLVEAMQRGQPFLCNDLRDERCATGWPESMRVGGSRALAVFALQRDGKLHGMLGLHSEVPGVFDERELLVLEEFAADTGFGLEFIAKGRRLDYLASNDPLTGLANHDLFMDRLRQAVARAPHADRFTAVVVMNLYRFRDVSTSLGRQAGDEVLRVLARHLVEAVREGDTVARISDNEFGVAFVDMARREDAALVAGQLVAHLPSRLDVGGDEVFIRLRCGCAVFPGDAGNPDELLAHARVAMDSVTVSAGHALAYFAPDIEAAVQEGRRIEKALHGAVQHQELALHYQAVIDVATGRVRGVEALLRWNSAELGSVSPARFIPVAEAAGLIIELGDWVLRTACEQAARWEAAGLPTMRLAVNVSVRQLREADFMEKFFSMCGLPTEMGALALEVTESALMDDMEALGATLRRVREAGGAVYVDDFGTGYSSLQYLQRLPVDVLKLDRSFVEGIAVSDDSLKIAGMVIALGHSLRLEVIAEGVETWEQFKILRDMGCDAVQGYLFSRPQPADEIQPLLERGSVSVIPPS